MARPITLFTGQWADLPFEEVCRLAGEWGYDGLEIACWGDHFEVDRALSEDGYIESRREILERHGLKVWAISNHLVGQAVCDDPIDQRHRDILPASVWGDGDPEGVRKHAAERMADTARAAARLGVDTVIGFTGSAVWKYVAMFPPVGGSHLPWGDPRRGWDFVSTGHGDVPWEDCFRTLNAIGYDGPISIEWEDAGMDRLVGAPGALEYVRSLNFERPEAAFDAAFSSTKD